MSTKRRKLDEGGEKIEKQRSLRQQIRDVSRLLSRDQLPETVRQTKERILISLKQELAEKLEDKKSQKMAKKYRMIKFFEKRKVSRRMKVTMKLLEDCSPEDRVEIDKELSELRMKLNYIAHYPAKLKYIALYPSDKETSAKAIARREKIMDEIAEMVVGGNLPDASEPSHLSSRISFETCKDVSGSPSARLQDGKKHPKKVEKKGERGAKHKAPTDEESDTGVELSRKFSSGDDFFLDLAGSIK